MRHSQLAHGLILLGELCIIVCGAVDFSIEHVGSCTEDVELAVKYTGSGSVDIVSWKFSQMTDTLKTLNILTSVCQAAPGADTAFPISRMTYDCDDTDKIYKITISPFNSTTDTGTWEARVSVSGTYTDFNPINIECESCKCECDCECRTIVIVSMVFGILGALGLLIIVGGIPAGWFNGRETLLLTSGVIGIVSDVLSLVLSIVVKVKECCKCCEENCADSECCKDWIDEAATAFIVIPCVAIVASVVIFILVKLELIRPGNDGGNGFFCFNNGNDDGNDGGNDGGNNGHHRGRGTNSSTVHTERADTNRGTLSDRTNSDGEVSRKDVHVQENRDNFSGRRPMPPIPLTDNKGRGLSANYDDDDHPMISVGIPEKKKGDLGPLEEEPKKKKKKKKKAVNDDDDV